MGPNFPNSELVGVRKVATNVQEGPNFQTFTKGQTFTLGRGANFTKSFRTTRKAVIGNGP
jgi:hypothetical protein